MYVPVRKLPDIVFIKFIKFEENDWKNNISYDITVVVNCLVRQGYKYVLGITDHVTTHY